MSAEPTYILFTFVKPENAKEFDVMLVPGTDLGAGFVSLCEALKCVPKVMYAVTLTATQAKQLKKYHE